MRWSKPLRLGLGVLLAAQTQAIQASAQQSASFPPACSPFMATGASVSVDPEMLKSLASVADQNGKKECSRQITQLQAVQSQMEEYRKNGNQLTPDETARQMAILNSSFEATQRMLAECRDQAESLQMVQASLDVTGIALFTVLQNNPGVWLVSAAVDALRRLGSLLTDLFRWKTLEEKATERVTEAEILQKKNAFMQKKMCLYVTYMDAVASLEDPSRQSIRINECSQYAGDPVCSGCLALMQDVEKIKDKLAGLDESAKCRALRWEITGQDPPDVDEAALAFGDEEGARPKPESLPRTAKSLVEAIQKRNPKAQKLGQAWSELEAKARTASGSEKCQELNAQWGNFLEKLEPYLTREEFRRFLSLRQGIQAYQDRRNQFSEGTAIEVTDLLINVQFFDYAGAKREELDSATQSLTTFVDRLADRMKGPNFCIEASTVASGARIAIREVEPPLNMCSVLLRREYEVKNATTGKSRSEPLFGEVVNPLKQSDISWRKQGKAGRALRPLCEELNRSTALFKRARESYLKIQQTITSRCTDGDRAYSIELPPSVK
jgi:hypothetical protein